MNDLKEFIREWIDDNEFEYDDDTAKFYALSRAVEAEPHLAKPTLVKLRELYEAEKRERGE